ncbi:hypothetical protein P775_13290 [Puniceibacterium antarcticum]|uniref:Fumarylacetoacetase-like C-terminal domain-containing protein n=1 Tax=Puniceibacterium antarcticum TaxID=1206336 RepID=A0A2G8RDT9_9RHOB|nr:hydratase [Puniceibacterium antarcticum]PIL19734.1 hypothetical protein P775_13290 [Puniceibacterium antarcticum]
MTPFDPFADALIAAHRSGMRSAPDGAVPTTVAEAYYVQSRVIAALGHVAGFKVGLKPGEAAIMAPIRAQHALPSGATVALGDRMGIELEVGWKIIAPLPAPGSDDFDAALERCVQPVPVIELVDTRLSGPLAEDAIAKLADFQINYGLIVGPPLTDWDGRDFGTVTGRMQAGESLFLDGPTEVPGGSALATLKALIAAIGDHCGGLRVGQFVITGSLHPLSYVDAAGEVTGHIDGLGAVSFTLS